MSVHASGDGAVTKQILRISLARLIQLSGELARARGGDAVALDRSGAAPGLVTIRASTPGGPPPVFLIHPVGGGVIAYFQLARALDPSQPVYAIENQVAFNPEARVYDTVEDMAAGYLEMITAVQDSGPYLLGGYSMGGLVAFEVARQLVARDHRVGMVAIIDTPARLEPAPENADDETLSPHDLLTMATIIGRGLERDIDLSAGELEPLAPDERISRVLEALREHMLVPPEVDVSMFRELVASVQRNDASQRRFRPQRYAGELDLLRAAESSVRIASETGALYDDATFGWGSVCARPVTVRVHPGSHLQLMNHPYVESVGAWLQERIDHRLAATAGESRR